MLPEVFSSPVAKVIVDLVCFKKLNVANIKASFVLPKTLCQIRSKMHYLEMMLRRLIMSISSQMKPTGRLEIHKLTTHILSLKHV